MGPELTQKSQVRLLQLAPLAKTSKCAHSSRQWWRWHCYFYIIATDSSGDTMNQTVLEKWPKGRRFNSLLLLLVPQAKTKNLKLDKILFPAVKCVTELIMCCTGYWHLTLLPVNYILAQGWIWRLSVLSVTLMQWWTVVRHTKVNRCIIHLDIHPTPQILKYFPNNLLQKFRTLN